MKNTKFFDAAELVCIGLFEKFNEEVLHLSNTGATPQYFDFDASGTSQSRTFAIELKRRFLSLTDDMSQMLDQKNGNLYQDLMIEDHKVSELLVHSITGSCVPLYINFLENAVLVYNLQRITTARRTRTKVKSNGYQSFELGTRYYLSLDDCWIYRENKLVKSPIKHD